MRPLIIHLENTETGRTDRRVFTNSPVYVGQDASPTMGIQLAHPLISSWHAQLVFDDQKVQVTDLCSEHGVLLNGSRVPSTQKVVVGEGAGLQIGPLRLRFSRQEAELRGERPPPLPTARPVPSKPPPADTSEGTVFVTRPSFPDEATDKRVPLKTFPEGSAKGIDALYADYVRAWEVLRSAIAEELNAMPRKLRPEAMARMASRFPKMLDSERWASLQGLLTVAAAPEPRQQLAGLLDRFDYVPGVREISTARDAKQFIERVAKLLEVLATTVLELKQEQDELVTQVANLDLSTGTALHGFGDARKLLAHMLDGAPGGAARGEELDQLLLSVRRHPFALLEAMFAGIRAMLVPLSPEEIRASIRPALRRLLPRVLWRRFVREYEDLEEESTLRSRVLNSAFARTYVAVGRNDAPAGDVGPETPQPTGAEPSGLTQ